MKEKMRFERVTAAADSKVLYALSEYNESHFDP